MFSILSRHESDSEFVLDRQLFHRTNNRSFFTNDVDVKLAGNSNASRIDVESVRLERHGAVKSVHGNAARVEHGTSEWPTLDVLALVSDRNLPNARLVGLEYGTVTFVHLFQRQLRRPPGRRVGRDENVFRPRRTRCVDQNLKICSKKPLKILNYSKKYFWVFLARVFFEDPKKFGSVQKTVKKIEINSKICRGLFLTRAIFEKKTIKIGSNKKPLENFC